MNSMLVQRPYLLKAFYNWIVDSECTPHIIVDVNIRFHRKQIIFSKILLGWA